MNSVDKPALSGKEVVPAVEGFAHKTGNIAGKLVIHYSTSQFIQTLLQMSAGEHHLEYTQCLYISPLLIMALKMLSQPYNL